MRVPNRNQSADEVGYAVEGCISFTQKWNSIYLNTTPPPHPPPIFFWKLVIFRSIAEKNKLLIFSIGKPWKGKCKSKTNTCDERIPFVSFGMSLKFSIWWESRFPESWALCVWLLWLQLDCFPFFGCLFFFFFHVRQFLWLGGSPPLPSRPSTNKTKVLSRQGSDSANASQNEGKHTTNSVLLTQWLGYRCLCKMTGNFR